MKIKGFILVLMMGILLASCDNEPQQKQPQVSNSQLNESLEKANRFLVNEEDEDINNYVARHRLDMEASGTGMRYQIHKAGEGDLIQPGQTVTMAYELRNIVGDVVYSSENDGVKVFVVGCGDVVSGLDEAIRHLHQGDEATVIVPSHLGYGLLGDQKDIPSRATLIYLVKILKVEK